MFKYFQVFKTTWQNSFVYRITFLMWRVRSCLLLLSTYFLWMAIFRSTHQDTIFNYQTTQLITYIILVALLNAVVMASRTVDLSWVINSGDLSNLILKPLSVTRFFFSEDLADKLLNTIFLVVEIAFFSLLFRPYLFWQNQPIRLFYFMLAVVLAIVLYFLINFLLGTLGFWTNQVWAARFLYMTVADVLAGSLFPLDIMPKAVFQLIRLFPFSWLVFFPNQIYLGRLGTKETVTGFCMQLGWIVIFSLLVKKVWSKGIHRYTAEGR